MAGTGYRSYPRCLQSFLAAWPLGQSIMAAITPETSTKARVLRAFEEAAPADLSMSDAARRAGVSLATASTYIKILVAESALEESRRIGNAKLFRVR